MTFPGTFSRGLNIKWLFFFLCKMSFHQNFSLMHEINQGLPPPARVSYKFLSAPHAHSFALCLRLAFAGLRYLRDKRRTWCTTCLPVKPVPPPLIFALSVPILDKNTVFLLADRGCGCWAQLGLGTSLSTDGATHKAVPADLIGFEQIRQSNTGQNTDQRAASDTMLTSHMFSPWCDCHRIGSALLAFCRNGAGPL